MNLKKSELKKMSLKTLRAIDIKSPEEEAMIQEVVDEKLADMPNSIELNIPAKFTDNLTPEKEKELQAVIDEKRKALSPQKVKKEEKKELKEEIKLK